MIFNSNKELKEFAFNLVEILENLGEKSYADDLKAWNGQFFTTSSEFLGELKLIMVRISRLELLDDITKKNISDCIKEINKAFGTNT